MTIATKTGEGCALLENLQIHSINSRNPFIMELLTAMCRQTNPLSWKGMKIPPHDNPPAGEMPQGGEHSCESSHQQQTTTTAAATQIIGPKAVPMTIFPVLLISLICLQLCPIGALKCLRVMKSSALKMSNNEACGPCNAVARDKIATPFLIHYIFSGPLAPKCSGEYAAKGCDGSGKIQGGIATVPFFTWWPIKVFRPCPSYLAAGYQYKREGQTMDQVLFSEPSTKMKEKMESMRLKELEGSGTLDETASRGVEATEKSMPDIELSEAEKLLNDRFGKSK